MIPMETIGCYLKQMHLPRSHPKKKKYTYCSLSSQGTQSISWVRHSFCISVNIHQHIIEPKQSPHSSIILLTACLPLPAHFPFHLQQGSQSPNILPTTQPPAAPTPVGHSDTGKETAALSIKKKLGSNKKG